MNWEKNISLKAYNTFGIDSKCKYFVRISSLEQIQELIEDDHNELFILGGGSNIVLPDHMNMPVVKNELKGISVISKNSKSVKIKIMSGESWHGLVNWAVDRNFGGIENLALIPGTVGAAPIQNIGAYGVELKDVLCQVETVDLVTGNTHILSNEDCKFGYRDSIFKNEYKNKYFITAIIIELSVTNHKLQLGYGAIQSELEKQDINKPSIQDVLNVVVDIRRSKLPDPAEIGNSGSFFKNIEINQTELNQLQDKLGEVLYFKLGNGHFKVPTGWLLEKCGWKGKTIGNVSCYEKQALIITNNGQASGREIREFAKNVAKDIFNKTGINISPEVNYIN